MSFDYYNQIPINNIAFKGNAILPAPLAKPIETVQKTIESFTPAGNNNENSKKTRNAITVGSSVLVLSALVALLNPRISPKIVKKLETLSQNAREKAVVNKNDTILNKFYKVCRAATDKTAKTLGFINNFNSGKDAGFKWFCTEEKDFLSVRNKSVRNVLKKTDTGLRKVFQKPHEKITAFFDKISQHTVLARYSKASKKMNSLEEIISCYKTKLTETEKRELETKLDEIKKNRTAFSKIETQKRFSQQESAMKNLERDFWAKYRSYRNGFKDKWRSDTDYINKNLSFWAEDILKPAQTRFEADGNKTVAKLFGNGKEHKGSYQEILEILEPHLSNEEKGFLKQRFNEAQNSLIKANHSECIDYFGKKRDLILGSAPTDIVSAILGLSLSGVALSTADTKDERISKLLTGIVPIMGGLGASMVFTARLISGPVGMIAGAGIGVLLNIIGNFTNKNILGNKADVEVLQDV